MLRPAGVRVSFREEWRIFAWAIGLLVVRHRVLPSSRHPPAHRVGHARRRPGRRERCRSTTCCCSRAVAPARPPRSALLLRAVAVIVLFWGLTFVMTYPQVRVLESRRQPGHRRPAALDVAAVVGRAPAAARSAASVRREHLLSGEEHARVLRRDARAVADGRRRSCGWACTSCSSTTCCCSPDSRCRARRCSCWCAR